MSVNRRTIFASDAHRSPLQRHGAAIASRRERSLSPSPRPSTAQGQALAFLLGAVVGALLALWAVH